MDPESNEVIGAETSEIGHVKVVDVREKFSICVILQGGEGAKKGDLVRREPEKN